MIPDNKPPAEPAKATQTSTEPWVLARVEMDVDSIIMAVPLINPKFQPRPSNISAIANGRNASPGVNAAKIPEINKVTPDAITIAVGPKRSTSAPVRREGKYIAAICNPIINPITFNPEP